MEKSVKELKGHGLWIINASPFLLWIFIILLSGSLFLILPTIKILLVCSFLGLLLPVFWYFYWRNHNIILFFVMIIMLVVGMHVSVANGYNLKGEYYSLRATLQYLGIVFAISFLIVFCFKKKFINRLQNKNGNMGTSLQKNEKLKKESSNKERAR